MRIYLLRHGQTVNRLDYDIDLKRPDPALDDTGVRQAELLGRRLQDCGIEAIYSSDLKRARETAQIIGRYTNSDIIWRPQLREIDMGEIPLQGWAAFPEYHAEWQKHEADLPYPQGEAGADVKERTWPVLDEITRQHSHNVAIVTHGGVIAVLLSACLGLALEKRFRFAPPANCSISTFLCDSSDGLFRVEQVNETAHLGVFLQRSS
jgi:broad specificity phosphatase PhoE